MFARSRCFLGVLSAAPFLGLLACGGAPEPPPSPPSPVAKPAPSPAAPPAPAGPCGVADVLRKKVPALLGKGKLDRAARVMTRVRELCPEPTPEVLAEDLATSAELAVELYDFTFAYKTLTKLFRMPGTSDATKKRADAAFAAAQKASKRLEDLYATNITKVALPLVVQADALAAKGDEASLRAAREAYLGAFAAHPNGQALFGAALVTRRLGDAAEAQRLFDRAFALLGRLERQTPKVVLPNRDVFGEWVGWSSDGRHLALRQEQAMGGGDVELSVFNAATGREHLHLFLPWSQEDHAALSSDGKLLGVKTSAKGFVLDVASRLVVRELADLPVADTSAFSPDLGRLAAVKYDEAVLLDFAQIERIPVKDGLPFGPAAPVGLAYSPDGQMLAIPCADEKVRLWDINKRRVSVTLAGHKGNAGHLAFSRDGKHLATSDAMSGDVRLWNTRTGAQETSFSLGADDPAWDLAVSHDGSLIATGNTNGVSVWDAKNGTVRTKIGDKFFMTGFAFSPDGQRIAGGCDGGPLCVVDVNSGAEQMKIALQDAGISSLSVTADGKTLAVRPWDATVRLLDLEKGTLRSTLTLPDDEGEIGFSRDGKLLGAGGKTVRVWNIETGQIVREETLPAAASSFAMSPDGSRVAVDVGKTIRVIPLATNEPIREFAGHTGNIRALAFSPDGKLLASGSHDHTVRLWNVTSGLEERILRGHTGLVETVAFSPDGKLLASGSQDTSAMLWDVETGKPRQTFQDPKARRSEMVEDVVFSSDGKLLAVGGLSNSLRIWELETGKARSMPKSSTSPFALAFTPDGKWLVTGFGDGTLLFQRPTSEGPTASIHFLNKQDAAHVLDSDGHADFLGKTPCAARARLQCRAGRFGMPFDLCEERAFSSGLLATILAGKPAGDDPAHEDVPPRCAP
ncbi:WD40 repeat domain-containing protein [Polyangium sp. y55x31]|uniref:WD40 repeat domain-containing protein n=1 Tax=Polyangium sp. y55x31 TaxID=3042688 RepID=UPI00248247E0|nr:WD40 repeat domain-containing protein [Polyangium sp. y55x31]MDI1480468.1 WD40 repeat domain-containing protein [Polyangium sp. y55x31]